MSAHCKSSDSNYPLTDARRAKFLSIWNGYAPQAEITVRLHYLDCHFPEKKLDAALNWLLSNKIQGRRFVEWFKNDCANSSLEMIRQLTRRLEKDSPRGLFIGKDVHA